jgi:hypothetical protein
VYLARARLWHRYSAIVTCVSSVLHWMLIASESLVRRLVICFLAGSDWRAWIGHVHAQPRTRFHPDKTVCMVDPYLIAFELHSVFDLNAVDAGRGERDMTKARLLSLEPGHRHVPSEAVDHPRRTKHQHHSDGSSYVSLMRIRTIEPHFNAQEVTRGLPY